MKVYLAGPMTGIPEFNYPAFNAAAAALRAAGHEVINPAESDGGDTSKPWAYYMRQNIPHVLAVDAIAVLPGWRKSRGARIEVSLAMELEVPVLDVATLQPLEETVLETAYRLVHGDRITDYGHPLDAFARTGRFWGATLADPVCPKCGTQFDHADVTPEEVGLCMVGLKISREVASPKRDNRVDGPGYFETVDMIHAERVRRATS